MTDENSSRALVALQTLNLRALAEGLNLPIVTERVEPPRHEALKLGNLSMVSGIEYSDLGAFIDEKVALFNKISHDSFERYGSILNFEQYLYRTSHIKRGKFDDDPFDYAEYSQDYKGYMTYLFQKDPDFVAVIEQEMARPLYIQETLDRRAHTLVTGGSRSGKSELLKLLIHHYVKHPKLGGVLVLDPHNELAPQVARWKEFAGGGVERLVYLNPSLGAEMGRGVPALNPLQTVGLPDHMKATLTKQIASALGHLSGEGETISGQMGRVAEFCITALMDIEGASLVDLWRGLEVQKKGTHKNAPPFVKKGLQHPSEVVRNFFETGWEGESYRGSRDALKRRLETFLISPIFKQVMEAPDPLNLEALLNAGKVVVVNCGFESEAGRALGRLLTAQVAAIGERRNQENKGQEARFHVFVDEATELMSPNFVRILEGVGKRNIWLTMGQQEGGAGGDSAHANRIATNTGLKFLGRTRSTKELLRFVEIPRDEIPMLNQGEFIVSKSGQQKIAMLLQTPYPSPVAKNDNAMSESEFEKVLEYQFANYYRRPPALLPAATATTPAERKPTRPRGDEWGEV
jgi:hypothetical protein